MHDVFMEKCNNYMEPANIWVGQMRRGPPYSNIGWVLAHPAHPVTPCATPMPQNDFRKFWHIEETIVTNVGQTSWL